MLSMFTLVRFWGFTVAGVVWRATSCLGFRWVDSDFGLVQGS